RWGISMTTSHAAADPTTGSDRRRWFALAAIVAAQFMVVLDIAIVNVALPSIKNDLHFSQESLQWVITAYSIMFGGVLLLGGRLADRLGRRRMFIGALGLFAAASLLSGLAWSEGSLIGFRALQGLGAALLSPAALALLMTTFVEGRERNMALGVYGAAAGSGGAAGVLLGGVLTSYLSWSWIFFINVPVGLFLIAVTPRVLRESLGDAQHRSFDVAGAVSITSGLMLLVYAMTRATQIGWGSVETVALLAASAGLIASFFVIELRSKAPLLPLRIFRLRTLAGSNLTSLLIGASIFSQFFLLTLYMQQVLHYSAIKTGIAYIPLTFAIIAFSGVAQALTTRLGVRRVLSVGMLLSAVALFLYTQLPVHAQFFSDIFPVFVLSGIGLALSFVPVSIGGLTGVQPAEAGVASGLINTTQQIGGAVGLAAAATISTTVTSHFVSSHGPASLATGAALTHGFEIAFWVLAALALLGAVAAAVLVERTPKPQPEAVEVEDGEDPDEDARVLEPA
ncbi:MAG TPA: DHA2 family efflux MFS transporter permease subunit, partial [Acidimicrobiales bacterium]|nr:DHA2 family efflux MFS transporter permease subunit [Acidimicrobiales bacterium]